MLQQRYWNPKRTWDLKKWRVKPGSGTGQGNMQCSEYVLQGQYDYSYHCVSWTHTLFSFLLKLSIKTAYCWFAECEYVLPHNTQLLCDTHSKSKYRMTQHFISPYMSGEISQKSNSRVYYILIPFQMSTHFLARFSISICKAYSSLLCSQNSEYSQD